MKKTIRSILPICFLAALTGNSQCISTSYHNGNTFSADNTIGVYNFSSPSGAQTSDNTRSQASSIVSILSGDTYYLKVTGFNFSIPANAVICGVTVEMESRATGLLLTAAVRDNEVRLIKGGVINGDNKAKAGDWGSSDVYRSYGGTADLWGLTITPADVNAAEFGVAISARIIALVAALPSAEIDHVRMRIDYNLLLPLRLVSFAASPANGAVQLRWTTVEEEDNGTIILERTTEANSSDWSAIHTIPQQQIGIEKHHEYMDTPPVEGIYLYRLKMISPSGQKTYSATKMVKYVEGKKLKAYPNPVSSSTILTGVKPGEKFWITDMSGKEVQMPVTFEGHQSCRLNMENVKPGIYFIAMADRRLLLLRQ